MRNTPSQTILKAIRYLLYALLIVPAIPAEFLPWAFFPDTFGKMLIIHGVIEIIVVLYLILLLFDARYVPRMTWLDGDRRRWHVPLISVTSFITVLGVTTFWSIDPSASFWGTVVWTNGLITLLHTYALFVVIISIFHNTKFVERFLHINFFTGLFVALVALLQWLGIRGLFTEGDQVVGTLGNPAYFSAYLIFIVFTSLLLFLHTKRINQKIGYVAAALLEVTVLLAGSTVSGAAVGVVCGVLAMVFIYTISCFHSIGRKIFFAGSITLIVGAVLLAGYLFFSGKAYEKFEHVQNIRTRLVAWEIAWDGWKEKILTGWGLENYNAPFEKYFNHTFYQVRDNGTLSEHALDFPHNKIFEIGVSNGLFAVIAYIGMFVSVLWALVRAYLRKKDSLVLGMIGVFVAYFSQNLFIFDTVITYLMLFCYLGLAALLYQKDFVTRGEYVHWRREASRPIAVGVVFIIGGILSYILVLRPLQAGIYAARSVAGYKNGLYAESVAYSARSRAYGISYVNERMYLELASILFKTKHVDDGVSEEEKMMVQTIIDGLTDNITRQPYKILAYNTLTRVYFAGSVTDNTFTEKGVRIAQNALRNGSRRAETHTLLGVGYADMGRYDEAIEEFKKALDLLPDYGGTYSLMARVALDGGRKNEALDFFEEAFERHYQERTEMEAYLNLAISRKEYARAIPVAQKMITLYPTEAQLRINLAVLYKEAGNNNMARYVAEELAREFPDLSSQTQAFIAGLK